LFCPASLPPFPFMASRAHTRVSVAGDDVTRVLLRLTRSRNERRLRHIHVKSTVISVSMCACVRACVRARTRARARARVCVCVCVCHEVVWGKVAVDLFDTRCKQVNYTEDNPQSFL